jgi:hypothetical protein
VHYLPHQPLDHSLADDPILLARQLCDGLGDGIDHFVRFTGIDLEPAVAGCSAKKSSISSTIMQWRQGRSDRGGDAEAQAAQ